MAVFAALALMAMAACMPVAHASFPLPDNLPDLIAAAQTTRETAPEVPVVSLDGAKAITFSWGLQEITRPQTDAKKYEREIAELLDSPLSDWAVLPEDVVNTSDFTVAVRPIDVAGEEPTQLVAYFEAEFKVVGSRAFFDFLVTPAGQLVITAPSALLEAEARAAGLKTRGLRGAQVFTTAQSTDFGNSLTPIGLTSTHWQTCGPNEGTYMAYPAAVPEEFRIPEVRNLTGSDTAPEFRILFVERVRQIDAETIKVSSLQWGDLEPDVLLPYPAPISWEVPVGLYTGLYDRIKAHFEAVYYPADTGNECPGNGNPQGGPQ